MNMPWTVKFVMVVEHDNGNCAGAPQMCKMMTKFVYESSARKWAAGIVDMIGPSQVLKITLYKDREGGNVVHTWSTLEQFETLVEVSGES